MNTLIVVLGCIPQMITILGKLSKFLDKIECQKFLDSVESCADRMLAAKTSKERSDESEKMVNLISTL